MIAGKKEHWFERLNKLAESLAKEREYEKVRAKGLKNIKGADDGGFRQTED